jgi:GNAT superfamily N-acetyltransferase
MALAIRPVAAADAGELGRILYVAFQTLADRHNFPRDFPSVEIATGVLSMLTANPGFHGVVAEEDGRIAGSNFIDLRSPIGGIGPLSVDPEVQDRGVGRRLMEAVMEEAKARNAAGIRLVQAAYHNRSLSLYTKLGFSTREPLSILQGRPLQSRFPGDEVRPAKPEDRAACNALCRKVHGFARAQEVEEAIAADQAVVALHQGRIAGYATGIGFFAHAVAETNRDLKALIASAAEFSGPGFLVPTRNHEVFGWCLEEGLRLVMQMTLMTIGLYNEPHGAYLPSILF